jgi:hypothetical protein
MVPDLHVWLIHLDHRQSRRTPDDKNGRLVKWLQAKRQGSGSQNQACADEKFNPFPMSGLRNDPVIAIVFLQTQVSNITLQPPVNLSNIASQCGMTAERQVAKGIRLFRLTSI